MTVEAEVAALVATTVAEFGRLDYAFNPAGIEIERTRVAESDIETFDAIMSVNVKGPLELCRTAHTIMAQRGGGAIVNIGANAANTFVLVYNLYDSEELFKRFAAGEGQAYFVGGLNASYLRRGDSLRATIAHALATV